MASGMYQEVTSGAIGNRHRYEAPWGGLPTTEMAAGAFFSATVGGLVWWSTRAARGCVFCLPAPRPVSCPSPILVPREAPTPDAPRRLPRRPVGRLPETTSVWDHVEHSRREHDDKRSGAYACQGAWCVVGWAHPPPWRQTTPAWGGSWRRRVLGLWRQTSCHP